MIFLLIFLCGFATSVIQFVLIREFLFVSTGNELSLGILFALWFLGIASGAGLGGALSRRWKPFTPFLTGLILLVILPWSGLVAARLFRILFDILPGEYPSLLQVIAGLCLSAFPVTFALGFIFPFACSISPGRGGRNIGWLYIVESSGGILGGYTFTFVLVDLFDPVRLFAFTGAILLVPSIVFLSRGGGNQRIFRALPHLFLLLIHLYMMGPGAGFRINDRLIRERWRSLNPSTQLLDYDESIYQNVSVARGEGTVSLFLAGSHVLSLPDEYDAKILSSLLTVTAGHPERVCLLGERGIPLLKHLLEAGASKVDVVVLDPGLKRVLLPNLPPEEREVMEKALLTAKDWGGRILFEDGRRFLRQRRGFYDMVVSLSPDPYSILLNRFHTEEFFEEVKASLAKGGIFATRISSSPNYFREESLLLGGSIFATLREVFRHVAISVKDEILFFASDEDGVVTDRLEELRARVEGDMSSYPALFHLYFQPERVRFLKERFSSRDFEPNRDLKPLASLYSLVAFEEQIGRGRPSTFITLLMKGGTLHILLTGAVGMLLPLLPLLWKGRTREGSSIFHPFPNLPFLYPVFITGLGGMASELILIALFQCHLGYIYREIGALVSSFMVGILAGGLFIQRFRRGGGEAGRLLMIIEALQGAFFLLLFLLTLMPGLFKAGLPSEILLFILVFGQGTFTGMVFPLCGSIVYRNLKEEGRAGGAVDFADHAGAFTGALITQILLLPHLGAGATFLLLGLFNLAGAGYVLLGRWGVRPP